MILTSLLGVALTLATPSFNTTEPMVHDPVMAYENGTYYLFSTGENIQEMTSADMRTWTLKSKGPLSGKIPAWTRDSVPGFRNHVWAPDIIRFNGRWYMAYSVSTFGRNTSAIGLLSNDRLSDTGGWKDEGCIIASRGGRDNWNAIDPNFIVGDDGVPRLVFGSFWDGIQLVRLDSTMHVAKGSSPRTIARRLALNPRKKKSDGGTGASASDNGGSANANGAGSKPAKALMTKRGKIDIDAGYNAIEAPFIFHHDGYYYLFVSWDYCCLGNQSSYRVVVGRSRNVEGPYCDDRGIDMTDGGGYPVIQGDKTTFQAAGHCAAYNFGRGDVFICHGYKVPDGEPVLVVRNIEWKDGWPHLK